MRPPRSKGCDALQEACDADPKGQAGVAKRIGARQSSVSRWINNKQTPEAGPRRRMQEVLGIDWLLWDEPAEKRLRRKRAA